MREASFGRNVSKLLPIGQATARVAVYTKWGMRNEHSPDRLCF
jgi:hypothetical protein